MKGLFKLSSGVVIVVSTIAMIASALVFVASFSQDTAARQNLWAAVGAGGFITSCLYIMVATFMQLVVLHLDWRFETYYDDKDEEDEREASREAQATWPSASTSE